MQHIVVYAPQKSNRLAYVLDWLLKECLQLEYDVVHDEPAATMPCIAYGTGRAGALSIPDAGLLWSEGIEVHNLQLGSMQGIPTLYAIPADGYTLPFDIFSAIFFLLSRYEEYYSYAPDKYGRYPAMESILYKNGWLQRPVVDEWVALFRTLLEERMGMKIPAGRFSFQPTYDIDIAWSYRNKGPLRTGGAFMKDVLKGNVGGIQERMAVLLQKQHDPYDSFSGLHALHTKHDIKPIYFILASLSATPYDKNIHPLHPQMTALIRQLAAEGDIGMHPSYYSDNLDTFTKEKHVLEGIIENTITISRQHYIKLAIPATCTALLHHGITSDYSMGYGTHLGFRAGTGRPFFWYDLQNEAVTPLRMYPFCFMDTTALYEEKLGADDAFKKLEEMAARLQATGSLLITVFHNFSLGTATEWKGWEERYDAFVNGMSGKV